MTQEEYEALIEKLENNELYKNSMSRHKGYQFRQFYNNVDGELMQGQVVRVEDDNFLIEGLEGFDSETAKTVIYNFKDGVLHSENGEPAIQYPGHYEIWDMGLIKKVWADGGRIIEYWNNGVPEKIERSEG